MFRIEDVRSHRTCSPLPHVVWPRGTEVSYILFSISVENVHFIFHIVARKSPSLSLSHDYQGFLKHLYINEFN